jgi:Cu(I)/Ag(I) efflux system periplasmic protein CusF
MKAVKQFLIAGALGTGCAFGLPAQAQTASPAAATTASASDMTDAEVRKVDKENRKITLKHGAIKSLDMPPMTMVFQVKDASMLDKLQPGDKIRFRATSDGGKMTVTEIQPVK